MAELLGGQHYYRATSEGAHYPQQDGIETCDICIIGAGFAGLGTAMSLMERGHTDTVVLEAERIGFGASGRNGGFVFGGFSLSEGELAAKTSAVQARALYRLTVDAVEQIRRRIARWDIACDARYDGIILANWFDDARILDAQQALMAETMGIEWQRLSPAALSAMLDSARYFGGLYEPSAFHFHPLKYAQGLARVLSAAGVRIREHSRAVDIDKPDALWRIHTANGEVRAREVLVCCGGYIDKLYPKLAGAILPIATYVMVTEPLGGRLHSAMRTGAAVYDTRFAFDYYRPLADTRLLWGGRISVRERAPAEVVRLLVGDLRKVYPQLADCRIDYAWSGMMSYGRHKMPQLGRLPEGLWYAMGFGGHGVGPTHLAGEVIASALLGDTALLDRFGPWGLPSTRGPAGLLAAQMAYWAYQFRDWLRE